MSNGEDTTEEFAEQEPTNVARVPTLLLLDTSHSMSRPSVDEDGNERPKIDQLNDGLEYFKKEIEGNYKAERAVDLSIITFGGEVRTEQEFTEIENWQPSTLRASGNTPMCEAIVRGANHLNEYRDNLRDNNEPLKKALVWLLTDGEPTDDTKADWWDKAQAVVRDGTKKGDLLFYAMGIGEEANMDTLKDLASAAPDESKVDVDKLQAGMFREFFRIVSESAHGHSEAEAEDADDARSQE